MAKNPPSSDAATGPPSWFCPETGIYSSRHKPVELPQDPFLDLPSFVLSRPQKEGTSALVDSRSGFSISYPKLREMVRSAAAGLHRMGVSGKDVVLILLPNNVFFPVIYFGVLSIGAIVTTMNPLSSSEEIMKQAADCGAVLVFTTSWNATRVEKMGIGVVEVPEEFESGEWEDSRFGRMLSTDPRDAPRPVIRQENTAALLYSSGTTGTSKGVVITHGNFIAMVELFVGFEASIETDTPWKNLYLAALPMFHIYGLSLFCVGLFSLGATVVVMRKFDVEDAIGAIDRYKVTHLHVVPPMLVALTRAGGSCASRLGSLKQVFCGATSLSENNIREFLKRFQHVDFLQGYGMTETTAVGACGFNTEEVNKYTSVGLLAPNMQAKVVDWQSGSCMPFGGTAELWLRGPAIMKGYLNNENATRLAIDDDGWLRTGDIAFFDKDGYLYIVGRLKDAIKYKGFQIAPADLEAVLISHPDILDVAVTSAPHEEAGEIPVAFVVRKHGSKLSSAQVIDHVAHQVAPYKKVRKVVFVDTLPRSPAGKILRRILRNHGESKL